MHNAAAQKPLPQHEMQCRSMKNTAAAPTPNISAAMLIVFLFQYLDFFLQNCFGLLWKVSGCRGLLVTVTPFPRVTANAESIF